jgi:hypothetical protein
MASRVQRHAFMRRSPWILSFIVLAACTADRGQDGAESGGQKEDRPADPCAGKELPVCPPACPTGFTSSCGEPCETEGESCGNAIGDGRSCADGRWQCSVHAPLTPDGCNRVCDPEPVDPCEGLALPACPAECPSELFSTCGEPCEPEGERCGNEIGDGRTCSGGIWQCSVHPPLGPGCNQICARP